MSHSPVSVDLNHLIAQFPKYQDPNRIRTDVFNVSRHSRTLVPTRGKLTLNTGQECELLMLEGTVPTFFRGQQYHTPVEVYITENYPTSPPMCYIRPTAGMSLKVGHRHVDQSGLVYLPYLHEWSSRTHSLVELCARMSSVFGADPPLFATPARRPAAQPVRHMSSQPRPSKYSTGATAAGPAGSYPNPNPSYTAAASPYGMQQVQSTPQPRPTPKLPPRPSEEDVRREKEAALTTRLQSELQTMYNQLRTEMDTAFEAQARLEDNQQEVEADVEELSRRKNELVRLHEVAQERCLELETYLEERKKEGEPSVDELIEPKDSLSQQMLGLVAENAALEDALYYLDVGVTDGVITMEVFLKEVRRLARKQFIARATMKKVERAQQELNAQKASFNAEQAGHRSEGGGGRGYYPNLPPQQQAPPRGESYMGGPPPGYTPTAAVGQRFGYAQPAAGSAGAWGGAAASTGGTYPSFGGGVGRGAAAGGYGAQAQTPYTQRR